MLLSRSAVVVVAFAYLVADVVTAGGPSLPVGRSTASVGAHKHTESQDQQQQLVDSDASEGAKTKAHNPHRPAVVRRESRVVFVEPPGSQVYGGSHPEDMDTAFDALAGIMADPSTGPVGAALRAMLEPNGQVSLEQHKPVKRERPHGASQPLTQQVDVWIDDGSGHEWHQRQIRRQRRESKDDDSTNVSTVESNSAIRPHLDDPPISREQARGGVNGNASVQHPNVAAGSIDPHGSGDHRREGAAVGKSDGINETRSPSRNSASDSSPPHRDRLPPRLVSSPRSVEGGANAARSGEDAADEDDDDGAGGGDDGDAGGGRASAATPSTPSDNHKPVSQTKASEPRVSGSGAGKVAIHRDIVDTDQPPLKVAENDTPVPAAAVPVTPQPAVAPRSSGGSPGKVNWEEAEAEMKDEMAKSEAQHQGRGGGPMPGDAKQDVHLDWIPEGQEPSGPATVSGTHVYLATIMMLLISGILAIVAWHTREKEDQLPASAMAAAASAAASVATGQGGHTSRRDAGEDIPETMTPPPESSATDAQQNQKPCVGYTRAVQPGQLQATAESGVPGNGPSGDTGFAPREAYRLD
eukprot:TRINITY_DN70030_c0_g1_i1.p1 TRINITY_DN70030_c0_g1~~TRINITY_DN70030_c0_g1_i1.p1  ORF type:complete len:621 (-),score=121.26 TRINITY_DN70030_c0_g1_i1:46-1791(-)